MRIFYRRPALALTAFGALIGLGNIVMNLVYHTRVGLDIRVVTGWVILFFAVDLVALIIRHFYGGFDE